MKRTKKSEPLSIGHVEDKSRGDFGGEMVITARTPETKAEVIKHFRMFDGDAIRAAKSIISKKPLTITKKQYRDNGAWFRVKSCLELEFSTPYFNTLEERTGFSGRGILPDLKPEFLTPRYPMGVLHYTHYLHSIWTDNGHICFDVLVSSQDWSGRKAGDRARGYATKYIAREVGDTRHEPEYLEMDNGFLCRNPNYLKQHAPHPAFKAQWLFSALVDWWLENEASDRQKEIVAQSGELMKAIHNGVSYLHSVRHGYESGIRVSWNEPILKWADFQKL